MVKRTECPLMYFVTECITISAPWSSGFCMYGLRKVLSTTTFIPSLCAIVATFLISTRLSVGLLGLSIHISLVLPGLIICDTSSSILGEKVT